MTSFWIVLVGLACVCVSRAVQVSYYPHETNCPNKVDSRIFNSSTKLAWGLTDRALRSTPKGFEARQCSIPRAGLGIFTSTFISGQVWLGEYEGLFHGPKSGKLSTIQTMYAWVARRKGKVTHYVDASDPTTSNWLRYVNCARHITEQNVDYTSCYGRIFYRTIRDIAPGTELLVYYGPNYARRLGVNLAQYNNVSFDYKRDLAARNWL